MLRIIPDVFNAMYHQVNDHVEYFQSDLAVLMKAAEQAAEKAKTIEKDLINYVLKENALELEE